MDYGERFRRLRKERFRGTVLEFAKRLGTQYVTTVYNIEREWRVPTLPTLAKHAQAIGCEPWDLLDGVETESDRVRALATMPKSEATREWAALLDRYERSTQRGGQRPVINIDREAERIVTREVQRRRRDTKKSSR